MPEGKKTGTKESHRQLALYLLWLVMDPAALAAHQGDPAATMKKFNLSPTVRKMMLGNPTLQDIIDQLAKELGKKPGDFQLP